MPDLAHSLPASDLSFLRIVAAQWGLELTAPDAVAASVELAEALCDAELLEEVVEALPAEGRAALDALVAENGRITWVNFTRRFGDVREMGAARRDRLQPHLHPQSAAEMLWYRALLGRAFFETPAGSQEFAFIPDDLREALAFTGLSQPDEAQTEESPESPVEPDVDSEALGRPASPAERAAPLPPSDSILDDATTLLTALRLGWATLPVAAPLTISQPVLRELLLACRLIAHSPRGDVLQLEPVRAFLEAPREKALEMLITAWQASETFDELRQLPGLVFEGEWKTQPRVTREFLLNLLSAVPSGQWWSLPAFLRGLKAKYPDFQRPAGDYDSWFIKRESDEQFLRGFASWEDVDGALVRYLITGPMAWLGLVELAAPQADALPSAFRLVPPRIQPEEKGRLTVSSDGRLIVERLAPRAVRYQVARFCAWDSAPAGEYRYHVTPVSLKKAGEQGLKVEHLLALLQKYAAGPVPPSLVKALKRWELNGVEARLESLVVLKVNRPEVLDELRKSKAARFLGEILGPTTVAVKPSAQSKVLLALAELGLLGDLSTDEQNSG